MSSIKWISVEDNLPLEDNKVGESVSCLATVICEYWDKPETLSVDYTVRKCGDKIIKKWLWKNRTMIDGWIVTHWAELPEPYNDEN